MKTRNRNLVNTGEAARSIAQCDELKHEHSGLKQRIIKAETLNTASMKQTWDLLHAIYYYYFKIILLLFLLQSLSYITITITITLPSITITITVTFCHHFQRDNKLHVYCYHIFSIYIL